MYSNEQVQEMITPYGLTLRKYVNTKNVYADDTDGYKYKFTLSNLKMGRKPHWIMKNPFAIDNIKLYLSKEFPNYELLDDQYVSVKTKMRFLCHKHKEKGIQLNTVDNIVNSHHACKYCGYEMLGNIKRISMKDAKELCLAREVIYVGHHGMNGESQMQYICSEHSDNGIQEMSLTHFKESKHPCKYCRDKMSAGESQVIKVLNSLGISYVKEKTFNDCKRVRVLEFDFYLPSRNSIIEFDGKQHYEMMHYHKDERLNEKDFELVKERDKIKNKYCERNNITLIRIPYWEFDNIEKILNEKL